MNQLFEKAFGLSGQVALVTGGGCRSKGDYHRTQGICFRGGL